MFDGYEITQRTYHSQHTEILRAVRKTDGLPVVLKVRSGLVPVEREIGLAHEYELGKTLECEHSVRHLALEHTSQKLILVLLDNKMNSLESAVPEEGFDLPQFFTLATEIVSAIEEIHSKNVIHRDINPTNIIVNSALDSVKLIDFGLATRISEELVGFEPPTVLQGTISYISPEQTGRINKPVDSRSDLYSLGVTFYRLITGKFPFDATDPGELIYSHIARTPVPVFEIRQDIPQAVSRVIEKLLEKSPAERYQTASGIKDDLQYLQETIAEGEKIVDFKPGQNEHGDRIVFSDKLYGREEETARLLDCFNKCTESGQMVTVTGQAGIGKTALIRELYNPITTQKGFFLPGKFDQLNKGLAYTALADALRAFIQQCLGQDKETIEIWKTAVQSSVGEFGQVLTDIIPEFQNLIGKQKSIAPVSPLDAVARRDLVFSNLMKDLCAVGSPLVIFLDDLQWADSATLSLLETVIEINPTNLIIILSYRDNEITPAHPAKLFLDSMNNREITFSTIHLDNLSDEAVNDWMNNILPDADKAAKELAAHVISKTEGNPFYVKSFLYLIIEKNYIKRHVDGTLSLDMDAIINIPADADVVAHLTRKIESLVPRDKEFLTQISILGNRFSMNTIGLFLGEKRGEYQDAIQTLVASHLLIKIGENIMFAHDRIQQAAGTLLDADRARAMHLKAGQNIRAALEDRGKADEHIEAYIHHYNAAVDLITDVNQRLELAKLNIALGKRLKSNAAYQAAESSFARAIAFLPPEPFETDYHMAIDLLTEYGEALFLNLKYEEGEKQFDTVITHSKSPLDSAKVYVKQINHHASHHNTEKAMKIALHALETLGVKLPKRFLKIAVFAAILKVKGLLKNKKPEDILGFPISEDPLALARMDLLSAAALPAYMSYPDYYPIIISRRFKIMVSSGIDSKSPTSYMGYALILCSLGDAETGYSYGRAALALMEKLGATQHITRLFCTFALFIHHWKEPVQDSIEFFEKAIASGMETGDYELASHAADSIMLYSFYSGRSINSLIHQYPEQHSILSSFGKDSPILRAKYWHQMLITMNDPAGDGVTVSGDLIDENSLVLLLEERQDLPTLGVCMTGKMQLSFLAGDYEAANSIRPRAITLLKALRGTIFNPICHFFAALTCIAYYRKHKKDASLLREAKRSLKKLKKWGTFAPDNYLYKAQLVEAEILSVKGKQRKALKLYEGAIENAYEAGNNLDLGIACECIGRYLESIGLKSLGLMQIRRSIYVFQNWGALNKSHRLAKEYGITIGKGETLPDSTGSDHSSQAINVSLDLEALAGTIKSLTSDLKYDSLIATLLDALMQSSGATRVVYIHVDQGILHIKAEKPASGSVRIFEGKNTLAASFGLPVALLEKCYSGPHEHVLENIKVENPPRPDEQKEISLKSILILPLIRHQSAKGLVYLENDLMEDAFRENHVQFLSLLAGQAAIAIENALVFEHLNRERDYSTNIIQNSPSLICGIDSNGITNFINPVITEITGYSKNELIGRNWWELLYPGEEYKQVDRLFEAFIEGEVVDYEMRLTCKNGDKSDITWNSLTKRDNNNNILEIIGFGNDITERKRMQEMMIQSEKMLSVGGLAAGMAHEINNPLAGMVQTASVMSDRLTNLEIPANRRAAEDAGTSLEAIHNFMEARGIIKMLERISESGSRAAEIVSNMLNFARKGNSTFSTHNLTELLDQTVDMAGSDYDLKKKYDFRRIEIVREYEEDLPLVSCESGKIQQVLLNILRNGAEAMQIETEKPRFILRLVNDLPSPELRQAGKKAGMVRIEIEDNGPGMDAAACKRVFEPFFTTKLVGVGTGLGLSVSYFIITENHGGNMRVESAPGKGVRFIIRLPVKRKGDE